MVDGVNPLILGCGLDFEGGKAAVNEGRDEGSSDVGDLHFDGEEGGVVGWEGVWTETGSQVSITWKHECEMISNLTYRMAKLGKLCT